MVLADHRLSSDPSLFLRNYVSQRTRMIHSTFIISNYNPKLLIRKQHQTRKAKGDVPASRVKHAPPGAAPPPAPLDYFHLKNVSMHQTFKLQTPSCNHRLPPPTTHSMPCHNATNLLHHGRSQQAPACNPHHRPHQVRRPVAEQRIRIHSPFPRHHPLQPSQVHFPLPEPPPRCSSLRDRPALQTLDILARCFRKTDAAVVYAQAGLYLCCCCAALQGGEEAAGGAVAGAVLQES